jgi:hypothetical protein
MRPRHLSRLLVAAGALLVGAEASGQTASGAPDPGAIPTCTEQGIQRVAVMVPPGKTADELRTLLRDGKLFPDGTQVSILQPGRIAAVRNQEQLSKRLDLVLHGFLQRGTKIDGTLSILLALDEAGNVVEATPNTRSRSVNRSLGETWKQAQFEPYVVGGCRVRAWIHVPLTFSSDWSLTERRVEVRTGEPPREPA